METKIKYLGQFELTTILDEDYYDDDSENPQEYINVFANIEDDSDYSENNNLELEVNSEFIEKLGGIDKYYEYLNLGEI